MFDIIAAMGRMRIKKKGDAKPFRDTMAYRLLLVLLSILVVVSSMFVMLTSYEANKTTFFIAMAAGVLCVVSLFYNLERARHIPVPDRKRYR
jgi:membrane protein YdbS with pleckstrin-like domain